MNAEEREIMANFRRVSLDDVKKNPRAEIMKTENLHIIARCLSLRLATCSKMEFDKMVALIEQIRAVISENGSRDEGTVIHNSGPCAL